MKQGETIVISVGGSLIVPDEVDASWLSEFRKLIEEYAKKGKRFVIICGGGKTARRYQEAGKRLGLDNTELDWVGIGATVINARLVKSLFNNTYKEVVQNPTEKINFKEKILIAGGWKPGCSTDYDTVLFAKRFRVKRIINLSNIDYAYDKDPRKYEDARIIKETSWKEFRKIVGEKWSPGLNMPFDPVASKEAERLGIEVAILNGKNIDNIKRCVEGKRFIGTLIR